MAAVLFLVPALDPVSGVGPYLPFTAAGSLVLTPELASQASAVGVDLLGQLAGGLVFAGYVTVLLAVAGVLFARRDA